MVDSGFARVDLAINVPGSVGSAGNRGVKVLPLHAMANSRAGNLVAPPMPPTPEICFSVFWARNGLTEGREGFKKVPGGRRIHSGRV